MEKKQFKERRLNTLYGIILCLLGLLINFAGVRLALELKLPIFLDCIGTLLAATLGGAIPGIAVGFMTNVINGIADFTTAYYGVLNVLIALVAARFHQKGRFKRLGGIIGLIISLSLIGGGLGSVLTWLLYGEGFGEGISAGLAHQFFRNGIHSIFFAQLAADMLIDLLDKTICVLIVAGVLRLVPDEFRRKLYLRHWLQRPLTRDQRRKAQGMNTRHIPLRGKVMVLIGTASIIVAVVVTGISFAQFHESTIEQQSHLALGVASVVSSYIDPNRVDEFITKGDDAPEYTEIRERMADLMNSSQDIEYVYAYRIQEDGCHVVFDPDSPDMPGMAAGEVIPFDEAFMKYVPQLLRGEMIDPVISNETYGWLLSVYLPIKNTAGECMCYAGVDISMTELMEMERVFLVRVIALFCGFFILILAVSLWLAEYSITLPINSMAMAAGAFAYDSESARSESLEAIRQLDIRTGDEIENLYHAISQTTEDTVRYIVDAQAKNEAITQLQNGLIMVLADLVESRDKCTGDHVRKTAAYTRIILNQMRREGIYADRLTDAYINDVVTSAPLHDVGKIRVSDLLLNKPGRLNDDEFQQMRNHTVDGDEIIKHAIHTVSSDDSGYLREAGNMAHYHHEKWDGSGYPEGLKGEEIPLSARVMAVADVFDALVSARSYKKPFPIDKALDIIREGAGHHFDPNVARAFLDAEDEVRRIAAQHEKNIFLG